MSDETKQWGNGWAFYKGDGKPDEYLPPIDNCREWIKGYCAAMADYDLESYREHPSIMAALLHHGIDADLLEACLLAAETVCAGGEWCRWPTVPVRGFERSSPRGWSIVEAMNDEVG
jgi:hypothetical protein